MKLFDMIRNSLMRKKQPKKENNNFINITKNTKLDFFADEMNNYISKYDTFMQNYNYYENNICPYCGCVLESKVNTTKKCIECKEKIIIRTNMYNRKRLLLKQDEVDNFEKYNAGVSEILFYERMMKNHQYIYKDYMSKFNALKNKGLSARDIMYSFSNQVGCELDNRAYKDYMRGMKKNYQDRVLECFDAIMLFRNATQEYVNLFNICEYKKKTDIALSSLTNIANRDVQIVQLGVKAECGRYTEQDFISAIHSGMIMEFLDKNNLSISDFKNDFFKYNHPFVLPLLENDDVWYYIEKALINQKKYNETKK